MDVVRLFGEWRSCKCGKSSGRYTDSLNAEIKGLAVPMGIHNRSIAEALRTRTLIVSTGREKGPNLQAWFFPPGYHRIKEVE